MKESPAGSTVVRYEIAPRSIAWILAALVGVWLFLQLRIIALLLLVALVFAGTFNPMVEWMERRGLKRFPALILLLVALLIITSLVILLTVPPLVEQIGQIVRDAPALRERLVTALHKYEFAAPRARSLEGVDLQ